MNEARLHADLLSMVVRRCGVPVLARIWRAREHLNAQMKSDFRTRSWVPAALACTPCQAVAAGFLSPHGTTRSSPSARGGFSGRGAPAR